MRLTRVLLVLAILLLAVAAWADTVNMQFTGTVGNTTLTIKNNLFPSGVQAIIDPYKGTINGVPVLLFCVDPEHDIYLNDTWTAYLSTPGDLSKTYLYAAHPSTASTKYGEMAWLAQQMLLPANSSAATQQAIQAAIWSISDSSLTVTSPLGLNISAWEAWAASNQLTSGYEIISDVKGQKQEYLVLTPEPSSFLLLGSGGLALVGAIRKRLSARDV